jgi:hypothetical protein
MGLEAQDGERVASINVETERHRVTLKYRSRRYGGGWTDVEQQFPVVWKPCLRYRRRYRHSQQRSLGAYFNVYQRGRQLLFHNHTARLSCAQLTS